MRGFLIGAACLVLAGAAAPSARASAEAPACEATPGLEAVLALPDLRFLLMGETHGTVEAPALFADIVCVAAAERAVVVGVEWPASSQPALDSFIAEPDDARAVEALSQAPAWNRIPDGRASQSMLDLLMRTRALRVQGRAINLVAFDYEIPTPGTSDERETGMARLLLDAAAAHPGALIVALTGAGHADKEGFLSMQPPVRSMAQHLPAARTTSLALSRPGGEAWMCRWNEEPVTCAAGPLTAREPLSPRGLTRPRPGFDAAISTGRTHSASPPAHFDGAPESF